MSVSDLNITIQQYKLQLEQVEKALENANEEDKLQLQQLQLDLLEILDLTLQQLNNQQNTDQCQSKTSNSNLDNELALFQAEIAELEGIENKESKASDNDSYNNQLQDNTDQWENIEGEQFRVPYTEAWGGFTYHNAVVLSYVPIDKNIPGHNEHQVRVLFSQPTSTAMIPCKYFLEGKCKFSDDSCHFSHGELIPVADLKEYKLPDLDSITSGSNVLVLHKDRLWHKAQVEDVLEDKSSYSVRCEVCKCVCEVLLQNMIPLNIQHPTDEDNQKNLEECDSNVDSDEEEVSFAPKDLWLQSSSCSLGDWEKFTKGIGTKLMSKMGYIHGTGLGPKADGRVDPVQAYVYPQGVSLDRCMELREASGGGDMLKVEKRLLKEQKKMEARQKLNEERIHQSTSVFDVINNKLSHSGGSKHYSCEATKKQSNKQRLDVSKKQLQNESIKDLNKKSFHISSQIKIIEKDLIKLKDSRNRQSSGTESYKVIESKIKEKQNELCSLKDAENKVSGEQQLRKDTKKMCVF